MKKIIFALLLLIAFTSPALATDWDIEVSDEVVNGIANYESWEGITSDDRGLAYNTRSGSTGSIAFPPTTFSNDFSLYGNFYSAEIYVSPVEVAGDYTADNVSSLYDIPICALDEDGNVLASGWVHFLSDDIGSSHEVGINVYLEYFVLKSPEDTPSGYNPYELKYASPSYNSSSGEYEYSELEHLSNIDLIQSRYSHAVYTKHQPYYNDQWYSNTEYYEHEAGDSPNGVPSFTYERGDHTIYTIIYPSSPDTNSNEGDHLWIHRHFQTDIHYYQSRTIDYQYKARETTTFGDFRFMGSGSMSGVNVTLTDSSGSELQSWSSPDTAQWHNYTIDRSNGVSLEIDFPDGNPSYYQYTLDGDGSESEVYYYLDVATPTIEQFENTMATISIGDPDNEYDAIYWFKDGTLYDRYKYESDTWYRYVNNTWTSTVESDALSNNVAFGSAGTHDIEAKIFYEGDLKASLDENIEVLGSYSAGELEVYAVTPDGVLVRDAQATIEDITNSETVYSNVDIDDGLKFELDRYNDYEITVSSDGYEDYTESFQFIDDRTLYAYLSSSDVSGDDVQVTFEVKDDSTLEPIQDALVTFNGTSKHVDANGKVTYTVPKNSTYTYTISADGYFSDSDDVSVTTSNTFVSIEMIGSGAGGDTGPAEEDGWTDDEIIAMLRSYVPPLFVLILFKYFMVVMGS